MKGNRTSAGNAQQFEIGDSVRVVRGSQWHTGHVGQVVDCEESRVLVSLPGPQPRTSDREWIDVQNVRLAPPKFSAETISEIGMRQNSPSVFQKGHLRRLFWDARWRKPRISQQVAGQLPAGIIKQKENSNGKLEIQTRLTWYI